MERLITELKKQYFYEIESELIYQRLAGVFAGSNKGISNFFIIQAHEERIHAMKFFVLLSSMNESLLLDNIVFEDINEPLPVLNALEEGLNHEKFITSRINLLVEIAKEEGNDTVLKFLDWFVEEQEEEEELFTDLINRLQSETITISDLDIELAKRYFDYHIITPTHIPEDN